MKTSFKMVDPIMHRMLPTQSTVIEMVHSLSALDRKINYEKVINLMLSKEHKRFEEAMDKHNKKRAQVMLEPITFIDTDWVITSEGHWTFSMQQALPLEESL